MSGFLTSARAVARIELGRQLRGVKLLWLLALALAPVAFSVAIVVLQTRFGWSGPDPVVLREEYANFFHAFFIRVVLFFGSLSLFMGLIRREIDDRTFHYLLLAPVARPWIVVGKYAAAVLIGWIFFVPAALASVVVVYQPTGIERVLTGPGLGDLASYGGMALLGVAGYGALFLLLGTLLRSPGYFVALFFFWEWLHFLLPPVLKQVSVVHYLKALTPVPISEGPFALLADPTPVPLAVAQLLLYSAVAVALAGWYLRRYELDYGSR